MTARDALLSTGIVGLDAVLGGGLDQRALVALVGTPGAGKTVLASTIVFNAVRQHTKALIFTSYSEGTEQYLEHMRGFTFFDDAVIGRSLQLFTLASQLAADNTSLATALVRTIRASGARIVLLDGFHGIEPFLPAGETIASTLSALATQVRYLDVTLLITLAGSGRDTRFHTDATVADIIINLEYTVHGRRHQRLLDVMKLRGRAQKPGLHSYTIEQTGVQVFPRIETIQLPIVAERTQQRIPFGLPELDHLLSGGLNTGTTTLLAGAPGVGKTTLALLWALSNATPTAKTLFFTFSEYPEQLQQKAAAFQLDLQHAIEQDSVRIIHLSSIDIDPDRIATMMLDELKTEGIRQVVFDDIAVLFSELSSRTRDYLGALNDIFYRLNITSLYSYEIPPFDGLRLNLTNTPLAVLGDNVIVVQQYEINGALRRLMAVLRMRLSFFDRTLRELVLDERRISVLAPEVSEQGLLSQGAKMSGGVAPDDQRDAAADQ